MEFFLGANSDLASDGTGFDGWTRHGGDGMHPYSRLHPRRGVSIALICRYWRGFFRCGRYNVQILTLRAMEQLATDRLRMAAIEYINMVDSIRKGASPSL